ncbi:hypothetical protein C8P63_1039 [Melghirimyces profundicolus]|uniref:Uncharacterized protein n=1 Tax=Melghirimyces profundicolus TaxID=1242148 RepID=A0A2T6C7E3_9BACL|nr:hypothetical protein [Melghirimyces profundicolus]PTX64227.1 hypothetical protein C8P63_1039 [Melghirimyces profundicolus]
MKRKRPLSKKHKAKPRFAPGITGDQLQKDATPDEVRRGDYTQTVRLEEEPPPQ